MLERFLKLTGRGREPLFVFLALGLLIFVIAGLRSGDETRVVEVGEGDVQSLVDQWTALNGRAPTDEELDGLIDGFVRDEVFFREARRLGLDENDVIIRRRLAQKLGFLISDAGGQIGFSEEDLNAFYEANRADYVVPRRWSFEHRYFSTDSREDAKADAVTALTDAALAGDPFILKSAYSGQTSREIAREFGPAFAEGLIALEEKSEWQGPVRSGFGWHVVLVTGIAPEQPRSFAEAREEVAADYQRQLAEEANEARIERLMQQYDIRRP